MNWKYIITKEKTYFHHWESVESNTEFPLDKLERITNKVEYPRNFNEVFGKTGLWEFIKESGQVSRFINPKTKNELVFFSTLEPIVLKRDEQPWFWNPFLYVEMVFENNQMIKDKRIKEGIEYLYSNNLLKFKNLATNTTTTNFNDFATYVQSDTFIKELDSIEEISEEILFMEKYWYIGWVKVVYVYVYEKIGSNLYPVDMVDIGTYTKKEHLWIQPPEILIKMRSVRKFNRLYSAIKNFDKFNDKLVNAPFSYKEIETFIDEVFNNKNFNYKI